MSTIPLVQRSSRKGYSSSPPPTTDPVPLRMDHGLMDTPFILLPQLRKGPIPVMHGNPLPPPPLYIPMKGTRGSLAVKVGPHSTSPKFGPIK